jgi:cyclophilin family peptidyl-prolyl cis-trans isomerase
MNRNGAWLFLVVAAVTGCASSEVVNPAPSKVDELLALARRQDPASLEEMEDALRASVSRVREVAAFGLGQLVVAWEPPPDDVRKRAESALIEALAGESDPAVRDRIVEALGKAGGEASVPALEPVLESAKEAERAHASIALGLIARSSQGKYVSAAARDAMTRMLQDADPAVRFGGAFGLFRYRDPAAKPALLAGLQDSDANVRSTCAKAFIALGGPEDMPVLASLLSDGDDRVAAEIARTLSRVAIACKTDDCPALQALLSAPGPFRPAVMQAVSFESWSGPRALPLFKARFDEYAQAMSMDPTTRALLQCQAALAHDRAGGVIDLLSQCGIGVIDDVQRDVLKARALVPTGGAELEALLKSDAAGVRIAAAAGAPISALSALLADPDPVVVGTAATRAEELSAVEVGPALVQALTRLQGADAPPDALEGLLTLLSAVSALNIQEAIAPASSLLDVEPYALRLAAAHALTTLTGRPEVARLPAPLDPAPHLSPTIVRMTTTRGTLRIRLLVEDAPRTAQNFVALVKKPFYDGITVHRVVPNFVSQAGDPRGDGSGGPGYVIPCEINMHRYGEGTVGMALAGRDTGGSQLFIAHSPQPTLDGLYTTFGEVIEGLDVATGLIEGDVILKADVE